MRSHAKKPNSTYIFTLVTVSLLFLAAWAYLISNTAAEFQNAAQVDPLAMINVLFPWFWILIIAFVSLCFASWHFGGSLKWLHIWLLCELSLFLYLTPFVLSGFSWSPDSLWHGGVAKYVTYTLKGATLPFGSYVASYPLSFVTTHCAEQVIGVNVFSYTLFVYPVICIFAIVALAYLFASRLLDPRRAFISILIALPALHFIEPHVSPFSAGTVLALASLVLLTIEGKTARMLSFVMIFLLTLTHPISPISLGIFLAVTWILSSLSTNAHMTRQFPSESSTVGSILFFLAVFWSAWTIFQSMFVYKTVEYALQDIVTLGFLKRLIYVSGWTSGSGFIYSDIHQLNLGIYALFLFLVVFLLFWDLVGRRFSHRKGSMNHGIETEISSVAFSSLIYAMFGYALFLATSQRFLLGRGLIFYIIMASMYVGARLAEKNRKGSKIRAVVVVGLIMFLLITFPIVSYSKEAYNTFTPSAAQGLTWISGFDLSEKTISMSFDQQLAAYVNLTKGVIISEYPPLLNETTPDFVVLRINSFFYNAMRNDLSFTANRYITLRASIEGNVGYNKVYSSSAFEVYSSSKGQNASV